MTFYEVSHQIVDTRGHSNTHYVTIEADNMREAASKFWWHIASLSDSFDFETVQLNAISLTATVRNRVGVEHG